AVLLVEDNGPGIPGDRITKIFDPFFTTRHGQKGAGLGLSIVHGMIQKMGGVISVDTTHGTGAKFEIRFPLPRSSFRSHSDKSKDLCTIPFSILVVDDDPHI
ncbi:MAG TPA: hybrid sensor histidine kinase/response regulator, partial [Desulfobacteraceae bacterium]|nr:hybrid sensor histidine kinase/response regulator [Desulfobacteraceae bacterium]